MEKTKRYIIAVDPDVEKNGVAILDREQRSFTRVEALTFTQLVGLINYQANSRKDETVLVLEDSDLSTNWHISPRDSKAVAAAKGRSVGMCHATARHIKEYAEHFGLEVFPMRPLVKMWKGRDGKITHEEASRFMRGLPKSTNQETRDAALLAWNYAGYPIRL